MAATPRKQQCVLDEDIACMQEMDGRLQYIAGQMWKLAQLVTTPRCEAGFKRHSSVVEPDLCELISSLTLASHELVAEAKPLLAFKRGDIRGRRQLPRPESDTNDYQFKDDCQYAKAVTEYIGQIKNTIDELIVSMKSKRHRLCIERYQKLHPNYDVMGLVNSIRWIYDLAKSIRDSILSFVKPTNCGFAPPPQPPPNSSASSVCDSEENGFSEEDDDDDAGTWTLRDKRRCFQTVASLNRLERGPQSQVKSAVAGSNRRRGVDGQEVKRRLDKLIERKKAKSVVKICPRRLSPHLMGKPQKDDIGDLFEKEDISSTTTGPAVTET